MSDSSPPTKKLKKTTTEDGPSKTTNDFLSDVAAQRNKVSTELQVKISLHTYKIYFVFSDFCINNGF